MIQRLAAARAGGCRVAAFKHAADTRYTPSDLVTHDARSFRAQPLSDAGALLPAGDSADVLGLDEAQFFGEALIAVAQALRARGKRVIAAGIDHDVWGRRFAPLPALKALADEVTILTTPCRQCGGPARFSQRMTAVRDGDLVGGPGAYQPRCAACFVPLRDKASA